MRKWPFYDLLPRCFLIWQQCSHPGPGHFPEDPSLEFPPRVSALLFLGHLWQWPLRFEPGKTSNLRANHFLSDKCMLLCSLSPAHLWLGTKDCLSPGLLHSLFWDLSLLCNLQVIHLVTFLPLCKYMETSSIKMAPGFSLPKRGSPFQDQRSCNLQTLLTSPLLVAYPSSFPHSPRHNLHVLKTPAPAFPTQFNTVNILEKTHTNKQNKTGILKNQEV